MGANKGIAPDWQYVPACGTIGLHSAIGCVKVAAGERWPRPVTLAEIKVDPEFANWDLVRNSRLSVMRVSAEQWQRLDISGWYALFPYQKTRSVY